MISRLLAVSLSLGLTLLIQPRGFKAQTEKVTVTMHLACPLHRVSVDIRSIPVNVSIANGGSGTVMVCNSITTGPGLPCRVRLWLEDSAGSRIEEPNLVVDSPPPDPTETLLHAVLRFWLPLRPGYSLQTAMSFFIGANGESLKPGPYKLCGSFSSYGIEAPNSVSQELLRSEDLHKLPYPVFQGRIDGNSVPLQVTNAESASPSGFSSGRRVRSD